MLIDEGLLGDEGGRIVAATDQSTIVVRPRLRRCSALASMPSRRANVPSSNGHLSSARSSSAERSTSLRGRLSPWRRTNT